MLDILMARRVASISGWSTRSGEAWGNAARWTLSGAPSSTDRTRFWYISSATKGVKGAMSLHKVVRQVCRVAYAAVLSSSLSLFQKRRRLRRTYQLDSPVHEVLDAPPRVGGIVLIELPVHLRDQAVQLRQDPPVQLRCGLPAWGTWFGLELVYRSVSSEK